MLSFHFDSLTSDFNTSLNFIGRCNQLSHVSVRDLNPNFLPEPIPLSKPSLESTGFSYLGSFQENRQYTGITPTNSDAVRGVPFSQVVLEPLTSLGTPTAVCILLGGTSGGDRLRIVRLRYSNPTHPGRRVTVN